MPRRPLQDRDRPVTIAFDVAPDGRLVGPVEIYSCKVADHRVRLSGRVGDLGGLVLALSDPSCTVEPPIGRLFAVTTVTNIDGEDETEERSYLCLRHMRDGVDVGDGEFLCPGCVAEHSAELKAARAASRAADQLGQADDWNGTSEL